MNLLLKHMAALTLVPGGTPQHRWWPEPPLPTPLGRIGSDKEDLVGNREVN